MNILVIGLLFIFEITSSFAVSRVLKDMKYTIYAPKEIVTATLSFRIWDTHVIRQIPKTQLLDASFSTSQLNITAEAGKIIQNAKISKSQLYIASNTQKVPTARLELSTKVVVRPGNKILRDAGLNRKYHVDFVGFNIENVSHQALHDAYQKLLDPKVTELKQRFHVKMFHCAEY